VTPFHIGLVLLANAVWGFNFVAAKYGVTHFPPIFFSGLRFVIVLAFAFPFIRYVRGQMRFVVGSALTMGVLHYSLMFTAMRLADEVSSLAVVVQMFVPFSTVIAVIFLGERIGVWRIGGLVLAFSGVMVIAFDPGVFSYIEAVVLAMIAALAASVSTVFVRMMRDVSVFNLQAWLAIISAPGLLAVSWIFESGQMEAVYSADVLAWSSIAFSAIGASLVGHGIVFFLLRHYPVTVTMPYMLLTPVLGVIFAVLILGDTLTTRILIGGFITLAGVGLISLREAHKRAQARAQAEEQTNALTEP